MSRDRTSAPAIGEGGAEEDDKGRIEKLWDWMKNLRVYKDGSS